MVLVGVVSMRMNALGTKHLSEERLEILPGRQRLALIIGLSILAWAFIAALMA